MTDTGWGRAVPNVMEMDTLPCHSRLMLGLQEFCLQSDQKPEGCTRL